MVGDRQPQTPAEAPAHARGPPGTERPAWHLPWAPGTGRLHDGHAGPAEEPGVVGGLATRRPQLRHPAPPWAPAVGPPPPASRGWPARYLRDWPLLPRTSGVGGALVRPCHWPGTLRLGAGSGSLGPGAPGWSCGGEAGLLRRGAGGSAAGGSRSRACLQRKRVLGRGPTRPPASTQLGRGAASRLALPRPPGPHLDSLLGSEDFLGFS